MKAIEEIEQLKEGECADLRSNNQGLEEECKNLNVII